MRSLLAATLVALVLTACVPRERNTWHPVQPGGAPARTGASPGEAAEPARGTTVVFAPIGTGPLAKVWPEAAQSFAYDLAARIDVLGRKADADGFAGVTLPASDDTAWRSWPVDGTRGASFVVLTTVVSLERKEELVNAGGGPRVTCGALVEMRALDPHGNVLFQKRGRGDWSGQTSPKFSGPDSRPESRAVWDACSNAVGALLDFLEKRNEAASAGGPQPVVEALVEVMVDSDPPGADVLVDGIFRGTTPCTLRLPSRRLPLRLELPGHQAWERVLIPEAGMRIKPPLPKAGG